MYGLDKKTDNNVVEVKKNKYKNPAGEFSSFCFEWLESVVQAIILVVFLMTFVFRYMSVVGDSMRETLHDGDKLIVSRWNYTPNNGDIIAISRGQQVNKPIIKRVIATEGQTLSIDFSTGTVIVDGSIVDESYIREPMITRGDAEIPTVIPEGYTFVMGDNRNHSADSRYKEVGLIDNKNIIGKAVFRIFPFSKLGKIS